MQIPLEELFQQFTNDFTTLESIDLGNNQIGSAGIMHLSKVQWKNINAIQLCLTFCYLAKNPVSINGTKQLGRTNWLKLSSIDMRYC